MTYEITSGRVLGVEGRLVRIHTAMNDTGRFRIIGIPEAAAKEMEVRVRAAIQTLGLGTTPGPGRGAEVVIDAASMRASTTGHDLAVAISILAADHRIPAQAPDVVWLGDLSLDGQLRAIRGALPIVMAATRDPGAGVAIVPLDNLAEVQDASGILALGARSLLEVVQWIQFKGIENLTAKVDLDLAWNRQDYDFTEVRGLAGPRRALEIAAAGGHSILMVGRPGSGRSMLARRLATILPPMTKQERIEVTSIRSAAGLMRPREGLVWDRPFRSPHHTASDLAMTGGGTHCRPGEYSLAHAGVLFLDELPEWRRNVLETLRAPIRDGQIGLATREAVVRMPARFHLVGAANPCPCGFRGSDRCRCTDLEATRYWGRIQSILPEFEIVVRVDPEREVALLPAGEPSSVVRNRVGAAVERRKARRPGFDVEMVSLVDPDSALGSSLSERFRVVKIARTIADLEGSAKIRPEHLVEAAALVRLAN